MGTVHNLTELASFPSYDHFDVLIVDKNFGDYFAEGNIEKTTEIFGKCQVLVISDSDKETIYRIHKLNITGFITIEAKNRDDQPMPSAKRPWASGFSVPRSWKRSSP